jgi:predicted deacylase
MVLVGTAPRLDAQEPPLPIREIRGALPGPTVAFVAGVHGGKVAAVHALDLLAAGIAPADLRGTVLLVGPANVAGYQAALAQTSPNDGLNLNRVFPGRDDGQPTERLAARIMRDVVARSDYIVDMHGSDGDEAVGDFAYAARPGIEATVDSAALRLASSWGARVIVWDDGGPRTLAESRFLQTAAHLSGKPAVTVFAPGSTRVDSNNSESFKSRALDVLSSLGMRPADERTRFRVPEILPRRAVTAAARPGTWLPQVAPGTRLAPDELLGTLTDSLGHVDSLRAISRGIVLHQRLPGRVPVGTALVIYGVIPDSLRTP